MMMFDAGYVMKVVVFTVIAILRVRTISGDEVYLEKCSGEELNIQCPEDLVIDIRTAMYGYKHVYTVKKCHRVPFECEENVKTPMVRLCEEKSSCKFNISASELDNNFCRHWDDQATLWVTYECVARENVQITETTSTPTTTTSSTTTPSTTTPTTTTTTPTTTTTTPTTTTARPSHFDMYDQYKITECSQTPLNLNCKSSSHVIVVLDAYLDTALSCGGTNETEYNCVTLEVVAAINAKCSGLEKCEVKLDEAMIARTCGKHRNQIVLDYICVPYYHLLDVCDSSSKPNTFGFLTSPGYPKPYKKNNRCTVELHPPVPKAYMTVTMVDIDMEPREENVRSRGCYDSLVLFETGNRDYVYFKFCDSMAQYTHEEIKFAVTNLTVNLVTDGIRDKARRGFLLYYEMLFLADGDSVPTVEPLPTPTTTTTTTTIATTTTTTTSTTPTPTTPSKASPSASQSSPTTTTTTTTTSTTTRDDRTVLPTINTTGLILPFSNVSTSVACENTTLQLTCAENKVILVIEAMFGHQGDGACLEDQSDVPVFCLPEHVTDDVIAICDKQNSCEIVVQKANFGHTCPIETSGLGLHVKYVCTENIEAQDICSYSPATLPSEGYLLSPAFPQPYQNNLECSRVLKPNVTEGKVYVHVLHLDLSLGGALGGCADVLRLQEGSEAMNPDRKYDLCSFQDGMVEEYEFSELMISFNTDDTENGEAGFLLYYQAFAPGGHSVELLPDLTTSTTSTPSTSPSTSPSSTLSIEPSVTTGTGVDVPAEESSGNKGGMIAGIIIALLIILMLVAVLAYFMYKRRYGRSPFIRRKPGRADLTSDTSQMNIQTYVELPTPAVYDMRSSSLSAHESALFDKNKNLTSLSEDPADSAMTAGAMRRHGQYNPAFEYGAFDTEGSKPVPLSKSPSVEGSDESVTDMGLDSDSKSPILGPGPGQDPEVEVVKSGSRLAMDLHDDDPPGTYKTQTHA